MRIKAYYMKDTNMNKMRKIYLPIIALGLDLLAAIFFFLSSTGRVMTSVLLLLATLATIAAIIIGAAALIGGKGKINTAGKIMAIVAIAMPLSLVAFILIILAGATMGVINVM